MKRRRFVQALFAAPAVPAVVPELKAQQASGGPAGPPAPADENPKLELSVPDAAAETVLHFFTAAEFAALRKLSDLLAPARDGAPGALDARAPEFLDFLIGASPADRQQIYRAGLDALNAQARRRFAKSFAETNAAEADQLLAPLREAWTYDLPTDPAARLLWTAKEDVRTATLNSREWSLAAASAGGGLRSGTGLYWLPID